MIIAGLVGLAPLFHGDNKLYAYAIGVLAGTVVQLAMTFPALRRIGYPVFRFSLPKRGDAARAPGARADAPGLGRPRADQHRPRPELADRLADLRRGAAGDRRRVPHLHAPAGHVLGGGGHGAVPAALAARRAQGLRGPAGGDRRRDPPDRPAADARGGGDARAGHPDRPARLPARRVQRGVDRADGAGAVLVRVQPAVQRLEPAAHAHVLLAPEAVAADRAGAGQPGRQRRRSRSRSTSRWASPASWWARRSRTPC